MTDLAPITALGADLPQTRRFGALEIAENSGLALASLGLRTGAVAPDLVLPGPGEWVQSGDLAAFWTAPDQWMIEGAGAASSDFASRIAASAPDCSVTEQTDGFVAFEIRSEQGAPLIEAMLAKMVNIDKSRFGPGHATRTVLHHMSVFVIRRADDHLAVLGMRSAAGTIWHALIQTAERLEDTPA